MVRRRDRCRRRRHGRHHGRGPRRLFFRVYLYGLLLLVAVTVGVGAANLLVSSRAPWSFPNVAGLIDEELTPILDRSEELEQKLDRLHRAFSADLAVYEGSGRLLAAAGTAPSALDEVPSRPFWRRSVAAVPLGGGRAYAVAHFPWQRHRWAWVLLPLVVLVVLAIVSAPLARNLVRPIERITQAARALGDGDLDARSGVVRRDEVGDLAAAFDDMAARLKRLVTGEKELRANVSHELRTPLARMRVALEIAEESAHNPHTLEKHLRGIRGDIEELEDLVDQILISARLDLAGDDELGLRKSPTPVRSLVEASAKRFRELHGEHRLEVSAGADVTVDADPKLVRRVIDNLLENSAKYADPEQGPVTLEIHATASDVTVTVSDRGVGVAPDDLDRLFEPFFRATVARTGESKGVGLGLSFCKRVVEAHQGRIGAERRPEGGLRVRFTLPSGDPDAG